MAGVPLDRLSHIWRELKTKEDFGDRIAYEEEVRRLLMLRSDVHYLFGDEVSIEWQHRLWRYGPNFDPKAKGGIWHKDTCPFGINGALPENSAMFTIVYILYTGNL